METTDIHIKTAKNEIVLGENEMVCSLTNRVVKATDKELTLQSMIAMMTEEYGFASEDMERDYKVKYEDVDEGKTKNQKVDLAIFNAGRPHDVDELIRFIIVAKDAKVKPNDKKAGVPRIATLPVGQMAKTFSMYIRSMMILDRPHVRQYPTFLPRGKPLKTLRLRVSGLCQESQPTSRLSRLSSVAMTISMAMKA